MLPEQGAGRPVRPMVAGGETATDFAHTRAGFLAGTAFPGLPERDRRVLARWLDAARSAGIDSAEDLTARAWPVAAADCIIGVFKAGHLLASWLVVGHGGTWAVACCADATVSASFAQLTDALEVVCPLGARVT